MGFDVVYLPPIHPIGVTNRKGPNNPLTAVATALEARGRSEARRAATPRWSRRWERWPTSTVSSGSRAVSGSRSPLDFAIQCSPDHPWVKEHPEWFKHRPDGTIKYAENPPKEYQDIYPIDFDTADQRDLMQALLDVIWFWVGHGVRIFRVDNPHTKPVAFWEWLIGGGPVAAPGRDFSGRGVHPAQDDEGAGQGRL